MNTIAIPHPDNPKHTANLTSVALLKAQGFQGPDASLSISLGEYGLAWREIGDELLFIHKASHGHGFDRTMFAQNLDVQKEFDWVKWSEITSFVGIEFFSEWLSLPLPAKLFDLVSYYGVEAIFGTTYWEGFSIAGTTAE